ncbi:hypothetical protein [Cryobacterium sp. TMT1-21]|uniref:hypothetical protein n=1 Tax=Cryobacterium sp. TMT1-21 TaxID=1259234 RepID=UPI00141AC917|nr:hypothetical protein [Cryobacterium sp. TMT1-21]
MHLSSRASALRARGPLGVELVSSFSLDSCECIDLDPTTQNAEHPSIEPLFLPALPRP